MFNLPSAGPLSAENFEKQTKLLTDEPEEDILYQSSFGGNRPKRPGARAGSRRKRRREKMKGSLTRRGFLRNTSAACAAAPALAHVLGANDRVRLGLVGAGRRGYALLNRIRTRKTRPAVFTAVCDVYPEHLEKAARAAGKQAKKYVDHRALLAARDVDAVVIASPDHWHCDHLTEALASGKDAWCETPLCRTVQEAGVILEAARKSKRLVQVGTQERSGPHFLAAKAEVLDAGLLGTIVQVSSWWRLRWTAPPNRREPKDLDRNRFLGRARIDAFTPLHFWEWKFFRAFSGGPVTEKGHHTCDWTHWFTGVDTPRSVTMTGGTFVVRRWEVPDTFTVVWQYPGFISEFSVSYGSGFSDWHDHGVCFRGTEGSLEISRRGWRFYAEGDRRILKESAGSDIDGAHIENFLACLVDRSKEPNAPLESAVRASSAAAAAETAFNEKRRISIGATWRPSPAASLEG